MQRRVPGPTNRQATTRQIDKDPLGFLQAIVKTYGDVVRLPFVFGDSYLINDPEGIRQVLQDHADAYGRDRHENAIFRRFVGESILTAEGASWQFLRRLEQPAFQRRYLEAIAPHITTVAQQVIEQWDLRLAANTPIEITDLMPELALRVIGSVLFSLDLATDTAIIEQALKTLNSYALSLFYHPMLSTFGPLAPQNRRGQAAIAALDGVILRLIRERQASLRKNRANVPHDILTHLLTLSDTEGQSLLTAEQIRNEMLSLLIAGHENVASLLCWCWLNLAQHPAVEQQFHSEIDQVLAGRTPTWSDLDQLPYTRMILEETLRLYPPAWSFSRHVLRDDEVAGYVIPAGATVLLCPYTMQRHPTYWQDPEIFNPERFRPGVPVARPRYSYFPFGGGEHYCMGATFALPEAQLLLAMMAQRYRFILPPQSTVIPQPMITMRPQSLAMFSQRRTPEKKEGHSVAENQSTAVVLRFVEAINGGDFAIINELVNENFIEQPLWRNSVGQPLPQNVGRISVFADMERYAAAFPDMQMHITQIVSEGDRVVIAFTTTGTHLASFLGVPPSGKVFQWDEIGIIRLAEGRIVEFTTLWDRLSFLQQLGLVAKDVAIDLG